MSDRPSCITTQIKHMAEFWRALNAPITREHVGGTLLEYVPGWLNSLHTLLIDESWHHEDPYHWINRVNAEVRDDFVVIIANLEEAQAVFILAHDSNSPDSVMRAFIAELRSRMKTEKMP